MNTMYPPQANGTQIPQGMISDAQQVEAATLPKRVGYGLQCANCRTCYDRVQERVDVIEAALHMDLKEAAKIVFEAVWSDPSDSSKTYLNAAQALLSEVRRRAGIATVLGPLQPLPH